MNTTKTRSLAEVRQEYSEARAAREQQLEGLRQELATEQRAAIAATTAGDRKAAAAVGSRLQVLTASVAAVEAELHSMAQHLAEAEVLWGQQRAVAIEATLPRLEEAARDARDKVKAVEAAARATVVQAMKVVGEADSALSTARAEIDGCHRVVGNAKVALSRLDPTPVAPGMIGTLPLNQRLARFVAREDAMVDGRLVPAGSEVLVDGPQAVQFNLGAAKAAPDQPTPLRSMTVSPAPDQALVFLRWEPAPPCPEPKPLNIPSAELAPPKRVPPPRRVRALTDIRVNGKDVVAGQILDLDAATALALAGNSNVEAMP